MADQSNPWKWDEGQRKYFRWVLENGQHVQSWQNEEAAPSHSRADSAYSQISNAYPTTGLSSSPTQNTTVSQSGALDVYGDSSYEADYYARYASNTTHTSDHQYSQYMSLQGSSQTANTQAGATQVGGYQQPHHATTPQSYTRGAVPCTQTYRPMYSSQYPNHQPSFRPENLTSGYNDVHIYGVPSQEGGTVQGTWLENSGRNYYEELDQSYYVRSREFFSPGRMIAVLFTEAAGSTNPTSYNPCISVVKYGEKVYTQIRRFIVVRQRYEFCYACPVFTYRSQATLKKGVRPAEHAVVHTNGYPAVLLKGENGITKDPIAVNSEDGKLDDASRIYFGIHHPIQYNVKVKDLGIVSTSDIPKVIGYWRQEQQ